MEHFREPPAQWIISNDGEGNSAVLGNVSQGAKVRGRQKERATGRNFKAHSRVRVGP
jgi:hypothetical protein